MVAGLRARAGAAGDAVALDPDRAAAWAPVLEAALAAALRGALSAGVTAGCSVCPELLSDNARTALGAATLRAVAF